MDSSELLQKISETLDALKILTDYLKQQHQTEETLGFCESPRLRFIYCNRQDDCNWYFMEGEKRIPIHYPALTGIIQSLEFKRKEVKVGSTLKESWKLRLYLKSDHYYCLESGFDTVFSKGLLSSIAHLSPQQLTQPLIIEPSASMEVSQVLFCRVYTHTGEQIYAPWEDNPNWQQITQQVVAHLKAVNENQPDLEMPPWDSLGNS